MRNGHSGIAYDRIAVPDTGRPVILVRHVLAAQADRPFTIGFVNPPVVLRALRGANVVDALIGAGADHGWTKV